MIPMQEMLEVRLKESKFQVNNEWMDNVVVSEQQLNTTETFAKARNSTVRMIQQTQQQQQSFQAQTIQQQPMPEQKQTLQLQPQLHPQQPQQQQSLQTYQQGRYQSQNKNKSLYSTSSQASQSFITIHYHWGSKFTVRIVVFVWAGQNKCYSKNCVFSLLSV